MLTQRRQLPPKTRSVQGPLLVTRPEHAAIRTGTPSGTNTHGAHAIISDGAIPHVMMPLHDQPRPHRARQQVQFGKTVVNT
jgi:hypothetical protein